MLYLSIVIICRAILADATGFDDPEPPRNAPFLRLLSERQRNLPDAIQQY